MSLFPCGLLGPFGQTAITMKSVSLHRWPRPDEPTGLAARPQTLTSRGPSALPGQSQAIRAPSAPHAPSDAPAPLPLAHPWIRSATGNTEIVGAEAPLRVPTAGDSSVRLRGRPSRRVAGLARARSSGGGRARASCPVRTTPIEVPEHCLPFLLWFYFPL